MGYLWMKENHEMDWINAFFGSEEEMLKERPLEMHHPSEEESFLNHGYNEEKGLTDLDVDDLQGAAEYRGGSFKDEAPGADIDKPVTWECAFGHAFKASVNSVLHGGHWCPQCLREAWK